MLLSLSLFFLYANILLSQFEPVRTPEGHAFCGMLLKPFNKFTGRVLSGLKLRGLASWFNYREDICLQTLHLLFKFVNHRNKRLFFFDSQWSSGWYINDNRWRQRYLPYRLETAVSVCLEIHARAYRTMNEDFRIPCLSCSKLVITLSNG